MEEKKLKMSVSKPGNTLSEGQIEANIKAILENDTEVQEYLAKIGISKGEVYQDVSNKKFIIPKKSENEEDYAKRYIKYEIVHFLEGKYSDKVQDDTEKKVKNATQELIQENAVNHQRGDVEAIIAMIQNEGVLFSKDGKTAQKLTPKQKEIIAKKLRISVNEIDELLSQIELEDEEPEIDEEQMHEDTKNIEEPTQEQIETRNEFDDENPINDIDEIGEEEQTNEDIKTVEEPGRQLEDIESTENELEDNSFDETEFPEDSKNGENLNHEEKNATMEDFHFRIAKDNEKREALENNPEYGQEYESVTCYIPPAGITIEQTAQIVMRVQKENPNQKITVSFNNILIDPQRFSSPTEIIEKFREEVDKRRTDKNNEYQDILDGLTNNSLNDRKKMSEVTPTVQEMERNAQEKEIIPAPAPAMDEQRLEEDDEHPYPEFPEGRE